MECPCRGCEKRAIACHSSCQDYKKWRYWKDGQNLTKIEFDQKTRAPFNTPYRKREKKKVRNDFE